jgi:HNH endonuclease
MTMTQEEAHRLFEYRDGELFWKIRPAMRTQIGDKVGGINGTKQPYLRTRYKGQRFMVHQIVFLMHHGFFPNIVDHIDGNVQNNTIENLRQATSSQNSQNQKLHTNNKSGHRCVSWHKHHQAWFVKVAAKGKVVLTRYIKDFELACLAADEARDIYHGNYAFKGA